MFAYRLDNNAGPVQTITNSHYLCAARLLPLYLISPEKNVERET